MFHEMLESGLAIRTLRNESDHAAFVDFNARYNNPSEGATCQCLIRHHPRMNDDDFFIVEDEGNHQIIGCLCLIPWKLHFEGVPLDAAYWRYLLEGARFDIRMLDDLESGNTLGYVMLKRESDVLCIMESGIRCDLESGILSDSENCNQCAAEYGTWDKDIAGNLLRCLASEAGRGIRIYAHPHDKVRQVAMEWGGTTLNNDQWLVKVEEQVALLTKLAQAFESRIGRSPLSGLTAEVIINQFRQAIGISIVCGKITGIRSLGFVDSSMAADGGDLCLPADAFLRLLFGYRSLEQLWDAWPDTVVRESSREMLGILFPKMEAHLLAPYHFQDEIGQLRQSAATGPEKG